jgi:polysaccharide chain length determinant protein (PEP-CTERM system associated)
MERKPPSSVGDFVAVLQRRKYWLLIPSVVVIATGLALSPLVPRTYKSTSTVLVQGQSVPSVYVKSADGNASTSRLQQVKLEVMSGVDFPQIIEKLNLYPKLRQQASMPQVIGEMRRDITVAEVPDSGDDRGGVGAFTISYIGATPREARDATREITNLFLQQSLKDGRRQAQGADSFLTTQVAEAGRQLATEQAKVQAFRSAHAGSLPEQAQADMQMVNQYQAAMQANQDSLTQANQQHVYLESLLNVKPNGGEGSSAPAPPPATPLQIELAQKQQELRADLMKYTPEHPDVIRLKHDIAALKVEIQNAPKATSPAAMAATPLATGPTMNDQLRSQLIALNADIKGRQARQLQMEQKIAELQGSVSGLPAVQTQFAAMNADYAEMQKNYNALLEKQQEAAMTSALNQREQSQPFVVVEPANLPGRPFRPDPVVLRMGVVLMGLLIGLLCALVVELNDDTMHDSDEVVAYLKLPVMVALPKCPGVADKTWTTSTARS